MRAAVLEANATSLILKDIPEPTPGAGDAVLQVLAAPVASYSKDVFSGALPYPTLKPIVPGKNSRILSR
jgi:alcohol dehydrogenase